MLSNFKMWELLRTGHGAPPRTVNGTLGQSIVLSLAHQVTNVDEVSWKYLETRHRIARYLNHNVSYFGPDEYRRRLIFHPRNFSLEIRDLWKNDTGFYAMVIVDSSGMETVHEIQLVVYEPVSGTHIMVHSITRNCNATLTCSATFGNPTSFRWWKEGEALGDNSTDLKYEETIEVNYTAEVVDVVYWCEARNPVSEDRAQIRLWNSCRQNKPDHEPLKTGLIFGAVFCILAIVLVFLWEKRHLVFSARVYQKGNGAGRNNSADPKIPETIYSQVQIKSQTTPEENKVVDMESKTLYITVGAQVMVPPSSC
ncbi:SLAM family member 7-like isoform X2 [Narcine bancroftii]|uniref:SLAM family member 7-like isoform X2 n=1 Tax=Narcine bancroftii TaxID=1343680 RepID=UPI0038312D00